MRISGLIICLLFLLSNSSLRSQEVAQGDILKIGEKLHFQHLQLPKANFIIKKGRIPDYSTLGSCLVEVSEIRKKKGNKVVVVLKPKNGRKFFGAFPEIKADYYKALAAGELSHL